jgi:predicted GTPase
MAVGSVTGWLAQLKHFYSLVPSITGIPYIARKVSETIQGNDAFGILVIGETGTGKSTLINNILGKEVAKVGHTPDSETSQLTKHEGVVCDMRVEIYDTPGLNDSEYDKEKEQGHLREIKAKLTEGKFAMVIFCFKMTETRMSATNIDTFRTYHEKLGLDWGKVIIALTYADVVPMLDKCKPPAEVYERKFSEWDELIRNTLRSKVKVNEEVVQNVRILPVTDFYAEHLPNKAEWFTPLWLSVLEILDARPMFCYLQMHSENIRLSGVRPPTKEEIKDVGKMSSNDEEPSSVPPEVGIEPLLSELEHTHESVSETLQSLNEGDYIAMSVDTPLVPEPTTLSVERCRPVINLTEAHDGDCRTSRMNRFRNALAKGFKRLFKVPHKPANSITAAFIWVLARTARREKSSPSTVE